MSEHPTSEMIHRYIDGELEAQAAGFLRAHLAGCVACRRQLERLEHTVALVEGLERINPPPLLATWIIARIREQEPPHAQEGRPPAGWLAWGVGLAGLVVLALTLTEMAAQGTGQTELSLVMASVTSFGQAPPMSELTLQAVGNDMTLLWHGLLALSLTAAPLALALVALGGSLQMLRWLMRIDRTGMYTDGTNSHRFVLRGF